MEERVRFCGLDFLVMVCALGFVTGSGGLKTIERACTVVER